MRIPGTIRVVLSTYYLIILSTLIAPCVYALDLGFAKQDGGQPGAFLSYGAGAKALGMGKTFAGVADDASAIYWNPAGLGTLQKREVTALYASLYENTNYGFVGYANPLCGNAGTVGIAVVSLNSSGFQMRDIYNYETGEAGLNETAVIISYGAVLIRNGAKPRLNAGTSVKAVRQIIDSRSATGYGADAGVLYLASDRLSVGVSAQNIVAPKLKIGNETDEYPIAVTFGAGYRLLEDRLLIACDVNKTAKRDYKLHLGGEYRFAKIFSLRAGLDETELAFGAGFRILGYSIDYAFAMHDALQGQDGLGGSHRIGFTIKFK